MIENSPIKHKTIYNSFSKLQRAASDGKFRVKSIRVKTVSNQLEDHITQKLGLPTIYLNQSQKKIASASPQFIDSPLKGEANNNIKLKVKSSKVIEKNYEQQLNKLGVQSDFLRKLFELKTEQNQNKVNEQRYQIFIKNFALRLCKNKHLVINQLGFGSKSLLYFLNWFVQWKGHTTELDLTFASEMLKEQKMRIIKNLLQIDEKLMSIILCNSGIAGEEIQTIFKIINAHQQLFSLDLSNINSQSLNRFGEEINILEIFIKQNQSVTILKLNNTQLKQQGFEQIWKGVSQRRIHPLKVLSIASNYIAGSKIVAEHFHGLTKSGILHLNLSENPLGDDFYKNVPLLKSTTIRQLDLSSTNMNSEQFYQFLQKIAESKSLLTLKVDKNDFSHHWFSKIGERLQTNNSLEWLSMNDCQIKSFMSVFHGLTQNKYLKKLHANNNAVDFDNEMIKRIYDCFCYNKDLEEIRFRFCNFNDLILIKLFQSIAENKKLKVIDISENLMEENGAEAILKMLEKNYKIEYLGIQKLQFSQNLRTKIIRKLEENKSLRQREELLTLEGISKDMRSIDKFTWEDVENYQNQSRILEEKFIATEKKVLKLEDIAAKKKQKVIQYTKQVKAAQKQIEQSIKQKIRQQNDRQRKAEKEAQQLQKLENKLKNQCLKETESIHRLEESIRRVNEKIKKKQNELQQKFRNHKYLQRKKKSKDRADPSPQRRPSVGHNHLKQNKNQI